MAKKKATKKTSKATKKKVARGRNSHEVASETRATTGPRNAVSIICTDRWRSLDFYRDALGAMLIPGDYPVTCPWLELGNLLITLVANTEKESTLEFSEQAMATLFLEVDDLAAAFERAKKNGARVIQPPDGDRVTFIVADPDGIFIEVSDLDR